MMVEAMRQGLWEEMSRDETVFVIGKDVRRHRRRNQAIIAEEAFEWLDVPVPFAPPMEDNYLPQVSEIVAAARKLANY